MRTSLYSVLSVAALGLIPLAPAQASTHWECMGFAVACSGSSYASPGSAYNYRSEGSVYAQRAARRLASRARPQRAVASAEPEPKPASVKPVRLASLEGQDTRVADASGPTQSTQSGMASYYGTESGSQTASGARFNPSAMTAAHRTLPFGTKVRVTNKRNGRSVVVTINDRGPFIRGRIIDLSTGAAGIIGMRSAGIAPVTVEVLGRS